VLTRIVQVQVHLSGIRVCELAELEDVRLIALAQKCGLVSREGRPFMELRLNLAIELADRPATALRLRFRRTRARGRF
jgi:hypothetical protein